MLSKEIEALQKASSNINAGFILENIEDKKLVRMLKMLDISVCLVVERITELTFLLKESSRK